MSTKELPKTVEELQALVLQLAEEKEQLQKRAAFLESLLFARKTEKKLALQDRPEQLWLFNEAELHADEPEAPEESVSVAAHDRKRGHRQALPEELPRKDVVLDIPEDQKICGCGTPLAIIRKEISEKLCIIPRQIYVERIIRPVYACPSCEGTETEGAPVKIASMPPQLIPHGIVSPELLTTVVLDKFCDALPLYRQCAMYGRVNIKLSRATLSRDVIQAAEKCRPLYDRLYADMISGHVIHMDETRVQVLQEKDRANELISTMWVMCGGNEGKVRYFHYDKSHAGAVAASLLEGFNGYLMTDGLKAYDSVGEREGLIHVSCLVHMRRRFANVAKMAGKKRGKGISDQVLDLIAKLYHKEKQLRSSLETGNLSRDMYLETRRCLETPILENIKQILDKNINLTAPKSALGDALSYALKYWDRMMRYLDCPDLPPDNNEAENAIRPFAVGRKNWLFAGSPRGADASSIFYTLIESAKANNVNVNDYLLYVLRNIAAADTPEKIDALLPWRYKSIEA